METPHKDQYQSRHKGCNGQSLQTIRLNNAVNNNDKCSRRAAYLHAVTAQKRNDKSADNSRNKTFFGRNSRSDTECNSQRQGHDTHNDSRHEVFQELLLRVASQRSKKFRVKIQCTFHLSLPKLYLSAKILPYLYKSVWQLDCENKPGEPGLKNCGKINYFL